MNRFASIILIAVLPALSYASLPSPVLPAYQYGRLTDSSNPLDQGKAYQYDKMSRVIEVKDPAGNITTYTYDALSRLTRKDIEAPDGGHSVTSYVYDKVSNLLSAANANGMGSFAHES